jgi:DNA-binding transcriptional ArsR family regulator
MLRIHFTSDDLARTTIAARSHPLWEVLLSLHLLQTQAGELVFGAWRRRTRRTTPAPVMRALCELAPPVGYSPDFLTPASENSGLDDLLDAVLSTPRQQIQDQIALLATEQPPTRWTRRLADADRGSLRRLGGFVQAYFQGAIAPYWRSIDDQLALDRQLRTQQMSRDGIDQLLSNLHPGVRWNAPTLEVLDFSDADVYLHGRGLELLPSYFCWGTPTKLRDDELPPVLVYPLAHVPGSLRVDAHADENGARPLAALLGRTRSTALAATTEGCTTSELARACDISLAAASQQASVLREAGLIQTRRNGRAVLHQISELGVRLLEGGTRAPTRT